MKQVLIRFDEPLTDTEAVNYALNALKYDKERKGAVKFVDGTFLVYSDNAKNTAITIYPKKTEDEKE